MGLAASTGQSVLPFLPAQQGRLLPFAAVYGAAPKRSKKPKPFDPRFLAALEDPARVVFLDVETTGLSWYYDQITLIGWIRGNTYHVHIAGDDLGALVEALGDAVALVTFNGTLFDLRFLENAFPDLTLPPVHIDLRYLAKRVGLTGGQKAIESELGITIRSGIEEIDGAEAVLLWHSYLRGDVEALARLVKYNEADVYGMCCLLDCVLDRLDVHPDLLFQRPRFAESRVVETNRSKSVVRPTGAIGPRSSGRTFSALFAGRLAEEASIVGIDLTGSEARPSGWCLLRGANAKTDMIALDDEIVARVLAAHPALVSIDSPLSIPFGRTKVEDDDPARNEFGIMRQCERELKRRGINVYPCLLPSMQGLTRRGMTLAARLRAAGVPVIESYPGAAQDILGIPRKGAGEALLKRGLADFGIKGAFLTEPVRHDELDAITSALVGLFFLARRFEALSGPGEDPLIIPELNASDSGPLAVGISGRIAAGKTTAARTLEGQGFAYTRISLVIDDLIGGRGGKLDRATRQEVGFEVHKEKGQRWLCGQALEKVKGQQLIVIDGLRYPEDHAFFAERFGPRFIHLHITASETLRRERYYRKEADSVAFEVADRQPVEAEVDKLSTLANWVLENNSPLSDFRTTVKGITEKLLQGDHKQCLSRSS